MLSWFYLNIFHCQMLSNGTIQNIHNVLVILHWNQVRMWQNVCIKRYFKNCECDSCWHFISLYYLFSSLYFVCSFQPIQCAVGEQITNIALILRFDFFKDSLLLISFHFFFCCFGRAGNVFQFSFVCWNSFILLSLLVLNICQKNYFHYLLLGVLRTIMRYHFKLNQVQ